jgi:hypothetical protein
MDEDEKRRFILIVSAIVAALAVHRFDLLPELSQAHALNIKPAIPTLSLYGDVQ